MSRAKTLKIRELIREARHILVVSHIRPDGDAIGSLLGMGLALQSVGKDVAMALSDGVPANFRHLSGSDQIIRRATGEFNLTITVDCADLSRAGDILGDRTVDLNIDHHITNLNFGKVNFVDANAVATCAILAEFLPQWGLPISQPVAEALLTGVVTDTLGFRTSNMTPKALRIAANLMEHGANLPELYYQGLIQRTYNAVRYWGPALTNLQKRGRLIWTTLTREDRDRASYPGNDDADLNHILSSIEGADIAVLFVEQKNNHIKVSWRSQPGYDVSKIALKFGGGGHPAASGADITGSLKDVQDQVLQASWDAVEKKQ
ncbi:MAG: bifunctional oligoribonuclease/PAP phosphatase NrnA [Anaerolineaceae bacterium]|nr:bifunctional oligoribonuclease/PAP phosphatase NrnA [Anaerolineaceae bacterium]